MKGLVVGASGQVGGRLVERGRAAGDACLGTVWRHPSDGLVPLDVRDAAAVDGLVREVRPDAVFLPAALTHMDHAEAHPDECHAINVEGAGHVARAVRAHGGVLVCFSTEHVFGDSEAGHAEDAPPAPQSVYAKSKAAAEALVRNVLPDAHLILRTSWVFGPERQRKNFVYRAVATLRRGGPLVVPADQHGQPTYAPDLADAALELVRRGARGTFHAVGPRYLSRLEFARLIAGAFGLDGERIQGVPTARLGQAAPRPLRPRLRRDRLCAALGRDPIRDPAAALRAFGDVPERFRP